MQMYTAVSFWWFIDEALKSGQNCFDTKEICNSVVRNSTPSQSGPTLHSSFATLPRLRILHLLLCLHLSVSVAFRSSNNSSNFGHSYISSPVPEGESLHSAVRKCFFVYYSSSTLLDIFLPCSWSNEPTTGISKGNYLSMGLEESSWFQVL